MLYSTCYKNHVSCLTLHVLCLTPNGTIAYIATVINILPVDGANTPVGLLLGSSDIVSHGADTQHPATAGDDRIILHSGTGMKHLAAAFSGRIQPGNRITPAVCLRIATGRHHHAQRGPLIPAGLDRCQPALQCGQAQLDEV